MIGSLEARGPAGVVALGGGKQRLLLAVLVLRAGAPVSRTALIDVLWPEDPPPSAAQSIESYVSRLRAAFRAAGVEETIIASTAGGYLLRREGNQIDWVAVEKLSEEAAAALARGDPETARDCAREGLALWRGPVLAELADHPAVRAEAASLEDRRLDLLEMRAEAQLALGLNAQVISGLRAVTPSLRERVHELLMLALYREGRQAEALDVYRIGRAHLLDELGLEPGPALRELQVRILGHDPTLRAPRPANQTEVENPGSAKAPSVAIASRNPRGVVVGFRVALGLAVVAAAVALAGGEGNDAVTARTLRMPAVGLLDAHSGQTRTALSLGTVATRIAAGLGVEWATSYNDGTLMRVDVRHAAVTQTVHVGHGPSGLAVAAGDVWVADTLDDRLTRVDAPTSAVVQQIAVGSNPVDVAASASAIWVANRGDGTVSRIDALTGAVVGTTRVGGTPAGVAAGAGSVWVAVSSAGVVVRLDEHSGRVLETIRVGSGPAAIAFNRDGVWVANEFDSTVSLIDPDSATVILTRSVTGTPSALAALDTGVWIAADDAPALTRLEASGAARTVALPSPALALAAGAGGLLIAVQGTAANHRGGTLVMRTSAPIGDISPRQCCDLPPDIRMLSYDSLVSFSKSPANPGALVPDLALAIPAPQRGGLLYTFRLRPGLRYWTGAPLRASDFRRGLERAAQSSDVFASYIGALRGALACPRSPRCDLSQAVLTDDRAGTVTLRLQHSDAELLQALGLPAFAPAPATQGSTPGTGPYRVARFIPGHLIAFDRNPFFRPWAPAAQPPGYPDRIVVYSDASAATDVAAVLSGQADYSFDTPTPGQLREIKLRSPGQLHLEPLPDTDFLALNTHAAPFNDSRVRRALNFAVDRRAIANLFGGSDGATPTCQIIPATIPGHTPFCPYTQTPSRSGAWTAPDLTRARQLIAESHTRGTVVSVLTHPGLASDEPTARYTVALLHQLGYRARLRSLPGNQRDAAITDYRHPLPRSPPTAGLPISPHHPNGLLSSSAAPRGTHPYG